MDKNNLKPNFFIIGAPKCGTTSLAAYLSSHHDILLSKIKEPNYFSDDLPKLKEVNDLKEYLDLFHNSKNAKISGEASTWYLYSKVAVENILKFDEDAKFIVMIRNPIQMAMSLHSQQVYNLNESVIDFNRAWELNSSRRSQGKYLQDYKNCCFIGTQLKRVVNLVNKDNIKIILFDDFVNNTEAVYLDVLSFLGVERTSLSSYDKYNSNKVWKYKSIVKFIKRPPSIVNKSFKTIKRTFGIEQIGLYNVLEKYLLKSVERKPDISDKVYYEMTKEFESEIKILENILSKDLSGWSQIKK